MKKQAAVVLLCVFHTCAFAQLDNKTIHDLKAGRVVHNTSYVYWLPWQPRR